MKESINFIKEYFCDLKDELKELSLNILNVLKTKKCIIILSSILLFILGCFMWKPLFPLLFTSFSLLIFTIAIMLIPLICSACGFVFFSFNFLDNELSKYPMLQLTLSIICAIVMFCFATSIAWDVAIKDMWVQPEMWNKILNL